MKSLTAALIVAASLFASTAGLSAGARVYVRVAPPAPRVEAVLVSPGARYVWIPGYYRWGGKAYIWVPGRYALPPRPKAIWVPAHWQHESHGWYVVQGHWR